jgi:hypothetical protein
MLINSKFSFFSFCLRLSSLFRESYFKTCFIFLTKWELVFLLLNETDLKLEKKKRLQQYKAFSIALSLYSFCNRNHVDILRFNNLKKKKKNSNIFEWASEWERKKYKTKENIRLYFKFYLLKTGF